MAFHDGLGCCSTSDETAGLTLGKLAGHSCSIHKPDKATGTDGKFDELAIENMT